MHILWNSFYLNGKQSKVNPYIKQNKHSYSIRTKVISCQTRGCNYTYGILTWFTNGEARESRTLLFCFIHFFFYKLLLESLRWILRADILKYWNILLELLNELYD